MRKIVQMASDSRFFDQTLPAAKSFLAHHPDWDLVVVDLGMTTAQRQQLLDAGRVITVGIAVSGRWPQMTARLQAIQQVLGEGYDFVLSLDSDTLTFGNVEEGLIEPMLKFEDDIAFKLALNKFRTVVRAPQLLDELIPWADNADILKNAYSSNMGVVCFRNSERTREVIDLILQKWDRYRGVFITQEESWLTYLSYAYPLNVLFHDYTLNYPVTLWDKVSYDSHIVPSFTPITRDLRPVIIAHFVGDKYAASSVAGGGLEANNAWQLIAREIEGWPWRKLPTTPGSA